MMNAAIDACERIDELGCTEEDRDATVHVNGQSVSVQDLLVSAWRYPERSVTRSIRYRHGANADLLYHTRNCTNTVGNVPSCGGLD